MTSGRWPIRPGHRLAIHPRAFTMSATRRGLLCLTLGLLAALTAARADELTTNTGKKFSGKVVNVDPAGVTFQTADAKVQVPNKEITSVDLGHKIVAPAAGTKYVEIELTDGSVIRCGKIAVKGKAFEVELLPGPEKLGPPVFALPLNAVFSVLRGADEAKNRDEWK